MFLTSAVPNQARYSFNAPAALHRGYRAEQSTFAPQSIHDLYCVVICFMKYHVPVCEHIPQEIKDLSSMATVDVKARGAKKYWVDRAFDKGLRDGEDEDGESIIYCMTT